MARGYSARSLLGIERQCRKGAESTRICDYAGLTRSCAICAFFWPIVRRWSHRCPYQMHLEGVLPKLNLGKASAFFISYGPKKSQRPAHVTLLRLVEDDTSALRDLGNTPLTLPRD